MTMPSPRILGGLLTLACLLALGIRLMPLHLPPLPEAAPVLPEGPQLVFGYATLANPVVRYAVVGRAVPSESARLEGWERAGRDLLLAPGAHVAGRVFSVSPAELRRLDRYEQAGPRYRRQALWLEDGRLAWVYTMLIVPPP
jgi:gamma-glutamylcyclotransferase (GGCT)/AIG2-like uncharacterized protein YtfP